MTLETSMQKKKKSSDNSVYVVESRNFCYRIMILEHWYPALFEFFGLWSNDSSDNDSLKQNFWDYIWLA